MVFYSIVFTYEFISIFFLHARLVCRFEWHAKRKKPTHHWRRLFHFDISVEQKPIDSRTTSILFDGYLLQLPVYPHMVYLQ